MPENRRFSFYFTGPPLLIPPHFLLLLCSKAFIFSVWTHSFGIDHIDCYLTWNIFCPKSNWYNFTLLKFNCHLPHEIPFQLPVSRRPFSVLLTLCLSYSIFTTICSVLPSSKTGINFSLINKVYSGHLPHPTCNVKTFTCSFNHHNSSEVGTVILNFSWRNWGYTARKWKN